MTLTGYPSLTLWRLADGKAGHEKQSLGLVRALQRLTHAVCHDISVRPRATAWLDWLLGRFPAGRHLPDPDLILAAGHATHLPALAARRARGGRIVVLMRPSLPLALFDLCLIPRHDAPPARANVIVTRGVLNAVVPAGEHDAAQGLILIGGPSRHYRWDDAGIAHQVREIVAAQPEVAWTLTTSRRTPPGFLPALGVIPGLVIRPHTQTGPDWLEERLARSAQAWVSPDSGSMIYETLTAGCHVGVLDLAAQPGSRLARDLAALIEAGLVTPYGRWRTGHALARPEAEFNEAQRCARSILERWDG